MTLIFGVFLFVVRTEPSTVRSFAGRGAEICKAQRQYRNSVHRKISPNLIVSVNKRDIVNLLGV